MPDFIHCSCLILITAICSLYTHAVFSGFCNKHIKGEPSYLQWTGPDCKCSKDYIKAYSYRIAFCYFLSVFGNHFYVGFWSETKLHLGKVQVTGGRNFLYIELYQKFSEYCSDTTTHLTINDWE